MYVTKFQDETNRLVQETRYSSANALELRLSCTNLSKCHHFHSYTLVEANLHQ